MSRTYIIILSCLLVSGFVCAEETLEWKECVVEAKKQHPDLLSAAAKIDEAKASKEITRSVMLPQITGGASEITNKTASTSGSSSSSSSGTTSGGSSRSNRVTTYQYNIAGQQLLFDGFKSSYDLSRSQREVVSSRYNYDVTSSNIRLNLRTAFASLLAAQELVTVTEEIEARRRQTLGLVRLKYEGGREHKGSLMTSEADLAQASFDVRQAKRNVYFYQRQLTRQLGRDNFTPITVKGAFEAQDADVMLPNFERLAQDTPLLQQLIAQKEAAKFGLKSAYADFFPQVYATGSLANTNTRWPPDRNQWSVGTTLSLPIFTGGSRFATVDKEKGALKQASENERSGRDGVIVTMAQTWTILQNAVENVGVRREFLNATRERARISTAEYAIGLLSYDNWIIIENDLVAAKTNYVKAQADALIAEANWVQAKGGTLDYDKD